MNAKIIALPVAAGLALGAASLATGADDPPDRPAAPIEPAPAIALHAGPHLPPPEPFGLHRELAEDMAKELDLPADRVADAMRKAIGAQFDRRRDEALKCFDDRKRCDPPALERLPPFAARPVPPGRTEKP